MSAGLGRATLDERYDERRLLIRRRKGEGIKSKEHLVAGLKGLGFGMLGGLTSVVTETYDGVATDGMAGKTMTFLISLLFSTFFSCHSLSLYSISHSSRVCLLICE